MFSFGLLEFPIIVLLILLLLARCAFVHLVLPLRTCYVPLLPYSSIAVLFDSGGMWMFPEKKKIAHRSTGVPLSKCFRPMLSFNTSIMSHKYSLTRNPTPPAPLSLPLFSYDPGVLSNVASYSARPLVLPGLLNFHCIYNRWRLLVRLFLAFCALSWRIHIYTFHDPILSLFFVSLSTLLLSAVPSPSFQLLFFCVVFFAFPLPFLSLFALRR